MGRAAGFLARWSRHKQLAAARAREPADTAIPAKPSDTLPVSPEPVEDGPSPSLPSIEALDAGSDLMPRRLAAEPEPDATHPVWRPRCRTADTGCKRRKQRGGGHERQSG